METKLILPFGMLYTQSDVDRGYGIYPPSWNYDPQSQVTDLATFGPSNPTTYSSIGSTGVFNQDTDSGSDDKGNND